MDKPDPTDTANLGRKAILSFIRLQLFLLLLLIVPAWTLYYWPAWLYWTLSTACGLAITLYLLRHDPALLMRRMKIGPGAEGQRSQKIIQAINSVLSCSIFVTAGLEHRFHPLHIPAPVVLTADAVLLIALLLVFRVFQVNSYTASTVQVESGQSVISTGPYAWVRHPMYTGSILGYLATPVALGSFWAIVPAVLISAMIVVRLVDEEHYLSHHLSGYDGYRHQVPYRLVPYVW